MLLVPFSLSQSLLDGELKTLPVDACLRWVKILVERGVFFHGGADFLSSREFSSIRENKILFKALGQAVKTKNVRLKQLNTCPVDLNNYESLKSLNNVQQQVSCVLVENAFSHKEMPINANMVSIRDENIEIVKINGLDSAHFIQISNDLSSLGINTGEYIETVWRDRFSQLADHADDVVIVDRFCLADDKNSSGLKFILDKMCRSMSPIRRVVIMTAYKDESTLLKEDENGQMVVPARETKYTKAGIKKNMDRLISSLKEWHKDLGAIREIQLLMAHNNLFGDEAHGRFIRFDNTVAEIDIGCSLFRNREIDLKTGNAVTHKNSTCSVKQLETCIKVINGDPVERNFHRDVENGLLAGAKYEGEKILVHSTHPD